MQDSIIYSFIGSLYSFLFQNAATEEKLCLEEEQRAGARDRKERCYEHIPKYFEHDDNTGGMDLFFSSRFLVNQGCRNRGATHPATHPQFLADQSTLF